MFNATTEAVISGETVAYWICQPHFALRKELDTSAGAEQSLHGTGFV